MLRKLAQHQAERTAPTHWVKIKSHTSVALNDKADELAGTAPFSEEAWFKHNEEQEDRNLIQFYRPHADGSKSKVPTTTLFDHFIQIRSQLVLCKETQTILKMCAAGTGRVYSHHALWKGGSDARVVKHMLQCLTNTFPTQSQLALMQRAASTNCRSCTMDMHDTLFHWLQVCPKFHNAHTRVHNDIWSAVYNAIV